MLSIGAPFHQSEAKGLHINIYAGNLARDVTEEDLRREFKAFGAVTFVNLVKDRFGGASQGFAYLGMPVQSEAEEAISRLHGKELKGRTIIVKEARPRRMNDPVSAKSDT